MIPGMNPQQINQMMKSIGIKSNKIESSRVIIECENEKIVIENPDVTEIEMHGQKSFQIMGTVKKEGKIPEEDLKMVMKQAGVEEEQAKKTLEECNGDIAEAIMKLKENSG